MKLLTMLAGAAPADAAATLAPQTENEAVKLALFQNRSAIERVTYTNSLAKHLDPELGHLKAFSFSDYKVDVHLEEPVALATESYKYRIETKSGKIAQRRGVATSVFKKVGGPWKILSMHNSARKPKGA